MVEGESAPAEQGSQNTQTDVSLGVVAVEISTGEVLHAQFRQAVHHLSGLDMVGLQANEGKALALFRGVPVVLFSANCLTCHGIGIIETCERCIL